MRALQVKIILGTVKIRRHDRNEICAMLPRVCLAKLDSGDFRDRVRPFVGSRAPVKSASSLIGWTGKPRVNARTSQTQKLLHAEIEACRNQIVLDLQILEEKFDRKIVISLDATDSSCCHDNGIGFICREKLSNVISVAQIQFIMGPNDEIPVAVLLKVAKQRTAYQTPVGRLYRRIQTSSDSLVQVICTGVKLCTASALTQERRLRDRQVLLCNLEPERIEKINLHRLQIEEEGIHPANDQIATLTNAAENLNGRISSVLASRSWEITAPLNFASNPPAQ